MTESSSPSDSDSVDLSNVTDEPPLYIAHFLTTVFSFFSLYRSVNTHAGSNQRSVRNGGRALKTWMRLVCHWMAMWDTSTPTVSASSRTTLSSPSPKSQKDLLQNGAAWVQSRRKCTWTRQKRQRKCTWKSCMSTSRQSRTRNFWAWSSALSSNNPTQCLPFSLWLSRRPRLPRKFHRPATCTVRVDNSPTMLLNHKPCTPVNIRQCSSNSSIIINSNNTSNSFITNNSISNTLHMEWTAKGRWCRSSISSSSSCPQAWMVPMHSSNISSCSTSSNNSSSSIISLRATLRPLPNMEGCPVPASTQPAIFTTGTTVHHTTECQCNPWTLPQTTVRINSRYNCSYFVSLGNTCLAIECCTYRFLCHSFFHLGRDNYI